MNPLTETPQGENGKKPNSPHFDCDFYPYPRRPPVYAMHVARALEDRHVANSPIGPDGYCFIMTIATREDATGYQEPVDFWSGQLMLRTGAKSEDTMARTRKRCVDAGWVRYKPGARGRAAKYYVDIPPINHPPINHPQNSPAPVRVNNGGELPPPRLRMMCG